jgi:hypothetical protein
MSSVPVLLPIGFVLAGVIAYVAHKRKWKWAEYL